ncbi:molybdopterin molybdotransferase MoeA [Rhodococcus sp. UNC23MFCrub1.1]|uniref:molybdopterin molybdotransferase MoeA n=1 Tax=Rhodococcus sp. UNC23MFCrub1.1 TaxID=1449068 RepID=UPI00068BD5D1|nr:gephyrin-like molybdotransferase Glp [Rhodococcus sp. UNC23MFCrub1.1]
MPSAPSLRTVEQHRRIIAGLISRTPTVLTPLAAATGLVLAEEVTASIPLPPFDNSAVDGYAVHTADLATAGADALVRLPVSHLIPAGHPVPKELRAGTVARIMTGAPLPVGADAVVPVEDARYDGLQVAFRRPGTLGAHVRRTGEDLMPPERLFGAGTVLTPSRIGLLAASGVGQVLVHRRIRVAVVSTGAEIVDTSAPLRHGSIHDANSALLSAAVEDCGAELVACVAVSDSVNRLRAHLEDLGARADVVITSGGVSTGDHEVVKQTLTPHGVRFTGVSMSPGRPQGAGTAFGTTLLTFPGNPLAAYASFEILARPILRRAMGLVPDNRPTVQIPLADPLVRRPGRHTLDLAAERPDGSLALLTGSGRHGLGAVREARCLVELDGEVPSLDAGATVTATVL